MIKIKLILLKAVFSPREIFRFNHYYYFFLASSWQNRYYPVLLAIFSLSHCHAVTHRGEAFPFSFTKYPLAR